MPDLFSFAHGKFAALTPLFGFHLMELETMLAGLALLVILAMGGRRRANVRRFP